MVNIDMTLKTIKTITTETEHFMKETSPEGKQPDLTDQFMHDLETTARAAHFIGKHVVSGWSPSDHDKPKEIQEDITL